jgi:phage gp36-like protein
MEAYKLQGGGAEQFTLVTSIDCDAAPLLNITNWANVLVDSGTATNSGDGHYYRFAPLPTSAGFYLWEWQYTISANTFVDRQIFEIVKTRPAEATGLYCNANDVRDLYKPLQTMNFDNAEIDEVIRDIMHEVDMTLAERYVTPFSTDVSSFPPFIGTITKNLALVQIIERKGGPELPGWVVARNTRYRGFLASLAAGSMTLVTSDGASIATEVEGAAAYHNMANYVPTFNTLDWPYQRVDPDRIIDEDDAL